MISIVTGTYNRLKFLPGLLENTVLQLPELELVLVDGGSDDGTLEYIKDCNHPSVTLIEIGHRSSYPHFMNAGVRKAKYDFVCQWNDDNTLINPWLDVINLIKKEPYDGYLFKWAVCNQEELKHLDKLDNDRWRLINDVLDNPHGQIVMNFGVYRKDLFTKYGWYDENFRFYFADGELSFRFYSKGAIFRNCPEFKVVCHKEAIPLHPSDHRESEYAYYLNKIETYRNDMNTK